MTVTVYSKPSCVQCNATYRALDQRGVDYTIIDLSENSEAFEHVQSLGYRQVPVVEAMGEHWAGFRPDKIAALG
ncbi:glutaredoxin-like protein NrdH [Stappia sp. BW2]|jgi:glutaredoxin-like protein NrdH|uniref:glutaredoxin-like protein NrdH n=1 Tax=Stappia sp. BW2 TaxID=2592622 RepID=UPI0011DE6333|nr:glutaredoxin-like protein NrdH [Stappia sp. BW2]TYC69028.1 glutaredoxin-like protein NrdH [Stappia sp. BW2]